MNLDKVRLLSEYGSFLKNNYLDELSEKNRSLLSKISLYPLQLLRRFSLEDLLKVSITNLKELLTAFEEKRVTDIDKVLKLKLEALPGIKPENIESTDLLGIYTAQKQALFYFIPKFTADTQVMMNLIEELEFTFLQATDLTLQSFVDQRIESATKLTESKVREETASYYNKELKTSNDEQKLQNKKLEDFQEELKTSYEELRNQNENLEILQQALVVRQEDSVGKEIELVRSNQYLDQFANMASHDLKEPLRMVKQYVQLISKRYSHVLDNNGKEFIGFAVDGVERMEHLIKSILGYAKLNELGIPQEITNTEEVLEKVKMNLALSIKESEVEISHESLPLININSVQLIRLFQNLLSNAIKYRLPDKKLKIHIAVEKKDEFWFFSVSDNGIGIEPENFERIFQPFQRLHSASEYEGIGLGLSFCKKIAEHYGGDMWVESLYGKGSTFFFTVNDTEFQEPYP